LDLPKRLRNKEEEAVIRERLLIETLGRGEFRTLRLFKYFIKREV
jgi:hypothetical protein